MPGSDTYAGMDFAFFMAHDGTLTIYEGGTVAKHVAYYGAGATLAVQVQDGVVTYLSNGSVLYTSTKTPTFPLYFDSALYGVGATINAIDLDVAPPCWQETIGVSNSGLSVTKTAGPGWNANAESMGSIPGDGYVEFTTSETSTHKMGGLTHAVSGSGYTTIDYAVLSFIAGGTVDIYEGGTLVNQGFGTYAAGDVFEVAVTGGVVTYLKNGSLLYTSTRTPTFPLLFDGSLYSTGATLDNVTLTSSSFWSSAIGVAVSGQSVVDTGNQAWGSGNVTTTAALGGDGYAEFSPGETSTHKLAGLMPSSGHLFQIYLNASTGDDGVEIFEDNVEINQAFGSYAAGDVFRVQVTGGVVTYLHNGSVFYTSTLTPTFPLYFNASLYDTGTTMENVSLVVPPFWQNVVGVSASEGSLTKTGSSGWNSGASTIASLSGDGYAQFTTAEANTHKMAGLTHTVSGSGYATIDYAVYLIADGTVDIFEDGTLINQGFGTYVAGDVFSVTVSGGVVTYLKNGSLLYTSTKTPTFPLYVDTSLYSTGATISNVSVNLQAFWQNPVGVTVAGRQRHHDGVFGMGQRRRVDHREIERRWLHHVHHRRELHPQDGRPHPRRHRRQLRHHRLRHLPHRRRDHRHLRARCAHQPDVRVRVLRAG